ncbi:ribosome biogenesis protein bop1-like [Argopecten irradians]|uniref:ribosome biogenesis protein bop1-like n=1 Tax=Argopecten irradians TaxID=31199 RepID=UPI0037163E8A
MATTGRKRTRGALDEPKGDTIDLFKEVPVTDNEDDSDSEESVYSGLEEEPDTESDNEDEDSNNSSDSSDENDDEEVSDLPVEEIEEGSSDNNTGDDDSMEKAINIKSLTKSRKSRRTEQGTDNTGLSAPQRDEYESDSSDEEDIRNTVGNVPLEWYRDYDHLGYDVEGRKIAKPKKADELDEFLNKMDNPDYWRTVTNKMTGQNVVLSEEDLQTIKRLQKGKHPKGVENQYEVCNTVLPSIETGNIKGVGNQYEVCNT